jgi:hypothetical protein
VVLFIPPQHDIMLLLAADLPAGGDRLEFSLCDVGSKSNAVQNSEIAFPFC